MSEQGSDRLCVSCGTVHGQYDICPDTDGEWAPKPIRRFTLCERYRKQWDDKALEDARDIKDEMDKARKEMEGEG